MISKCDNLEITKSDSQVLMQTINNANILIEKYPHLFTDNLNSYSFNVFRQDSDTSSASSVGSPHISAISCIDSSTDSEISSRRNSTIIGKFQQLESLATTAVSNDLFVSSKSFLVPAKNKTKAKYIRAAKSNKATTSVNSFPICDMNLNNMNPTVDAHIKRPLADNSLSNIVNRLNEYKSAVPVQTHPPTQKYTFSQLVGNPRFEATHDVVVDPFDLVDCSEEASSSIKKVRKHPTSYEHYKTMYQTDPASLLELRKRHREMVLEAARANPIVRDKKLPITVGANRQVFEAGIFTNFIILLYL